MRQCSTCTKVDWQILSLFSNPEEGHLLLLHKSRVSSWNISVVGLSTWRQRGPLLVGQTIDLSFWKSEGSISSLNGPSFSSFLCWADMRMFLSRHHIQRSFARVTNSLDTVPPKLLIYATAVVLSRHTSNNMFFAKVWTARIAARSSKQFMCTFLFILDQGPPVLWWEHVAPHPVRDASDSIIKSISLLLSPSICSCCQSTNWVPLCNPEIV